MVKLTQIFRNKNYSIKSLILSVIFLLLYKLHFTLESFQISLSATNCSVSKLKNLISGTFGFICRRNNYFLRHSFVLKSCLALQVLSTSWSIVWMLCKIVSSCLPLQMWCERGHAICLLRLF